MTSSLSFLDAYHTAGADGSVRVSAEQASRFAKDIAGDHNPLHDVGARRFCVPGDLLFALVLDRYGLSRRMRFTFRDMVGADAPLYMPETDTGTIAVHDADGGVYLEVGREGGICRDPSLIERFLCRYAAFSGKTFPHYMIPVLEAHGVMFHPDRPLVIYEGMGFDLETFDLAQPALEMAGSDLEIEGKRGHATLRFTMNEDGRPLGTGWKRLVISGLREYDSERMQAFVETFRRRRAEYEAERDGAQRGAGSI